MANLSVITLGGLKVALDETPVVFQTNKARILLVYLVVERNLQHFRESLAGLLWPDQHQDTARQSLRQTLLSLRRSLSNEEVERPFLIITPQTIEINPNSEITLDKDRFQDLLVFDQWHNPNPHRPSLIPQEGLHRLKEALSLFHGPFLHLINYSGSHVFDDWVTIHREELRWQMLKACSNLISYYTATGEHDQVIEYAHHYLLYEPLDEKVNCSLMYALASSGKRNSALLIFEQLRKNLFKELNIEPEARTRELYRLIRKGQLSLEPKILDW
jgi:DNA-binding SARP family transcriptional activator